MEDVGRRTTGAVLTHQIIFFIVSTAGPAGDGRCHAVALPHPRSGLVEGRDYGMLSLLVWRKWGVG